jgi:hypothetical protein
MKKLLLDLFTSLLLGIGCLALLSPAFFYWWVNGSYERYVWIINGPAPYNSFGSGPYQLLNFFILPIVLSIILIIISVIIRRKLLK